MKNGPDKLVQPDLQYSRYQKRHAVDEQRECHIIEDAQHRPSRDRVVRIEGVKNHSVYRYVAEYARNELQIHEDQPRPFFQLAENADDDQGNGRGQGGDIRYDDEILHTLCSVIIQSRDSPVYKETEGGKAEKWKNQPFS